MDLADQSLSLGSESTGGAGVVVHHSLRGAKLHGSGEVLLLDGIMQLAGQALPFLDYVGLLADLQRREPVTVYGIEPQGDEGTTKASVFPSPGAKVVRSLRQLVRKLRACRSK